MPSLFRLTTRNAVSCLVLCTWAVLGAPPKTSADVASTVRQWTHPPSQAPHPAVVRIVAAEKDAVSCGSGTLVHTDDQYGYVITNWHVVRDARQTVIVRFPSGQQALASVAKMDPDWDLALLVIWRPDVVPIRMAERVPLPGDALTIAGYGQREKFRAARGVCTTYAAPTPQMPFDMIEVSIEARQGDSGGPIVNNNGELAGVLFGAGHGRTTGSHIGRVRQFLASAGVTPTGPDQRPAVNAVARASHDGPAQTAATPRLNIPDRAPPSTFGEWQLETEATTPAAALVAVTPARPPESDSSSEPSTPQTTEATEVAQAPPAVSPRLPTCSVASANALASKPPDIRLLVGPVWDQLKSILAVFGLIALAYHFIRIPLVSRRSS